MRGRPDPRALPRLVRLLRRERPDVFCSFLQAANTVGRPAARLAGVPVVVSSVRAPIPHSAPHEWMLRLTRSFHDAVVFNSRRNADDAIARRLVPAREVSVIVNGLDLEAIDAAAGARAEVRAELGIDDEAFVWLVVGHLRPEKNYPTLVRAFAALSREHPGARLVSAGGLYDDHDEVVRLAGPALRDGRIRLLGVRTDVPRLLASADAFVLPSIYDASPNGLIEAMAAGLPCVASAVGGVPEIAGDPPAVELASAPGEGEVLAAMRRVMGMSAAERAALGERARRSVRARYGLSRMVDEWEALFQRLLARRDPAGARP